MANGFGDSTIFGPDLSLTPDQQSLLRTAPASNSPNKPKLNGSSSALESNQNSTPVRPVMDPPNNPLYRSPIQDVSSLGVDDGFGIDDSPFIDGHDFEDGNFDWDNNGEQLFGDLPEGPDEEGGDIHDKRKSGHEDDNELGQNKRREGNEKHNKKPGRKPLNNSEPTTVSLPRAWLSYPYTNAREEA